MLKKQIDQDIKAALLAADSQKVTTLRSLKSAILYEEVAKGARSEGLDDDAISVVLAKEAKKRQESADLFLRGNNETKAQQELIEKAIIEGYLPQQLTDDELMAIIDEAIDAHAHQDTGAAVLGKVIAQTKAKVGPRAEGSRIAAMAKRRLN